MPTQVDVDELRTANQSIEDMVNEALSDFVGGFDLARPEAMAAEMLAFVPVLVNHYGDIAATVSADWYDETRNVNLIKGAFRAPLAPLVPEPVVQGTVRRVAGYLFTETADLLLPALLDKAVEYTLRPGRDTIVRASIEDPKSAGWRRVTRAGSCDFCRFLAARGGVYRKATADFASHGHCHCTAAPEWDQDAPEVDVRAYEASQRTSGMSDRAREAHRERLRGWLTEFDG